MTFYQTQPPFLALPPREYGAVNPDPAERGAPPDPDTDGRVPFPTKA